MISSIRVEIQANISIVSVKETMMALSRYYIIDKNTPDYRKLKKMV